MQADIVAVISEFYGYYSIRFSFRVSLRVPVRIRISDGFRISVNMCINICIVHVFDIHICSSAFSPWLALRKK